MAEVLSQSQIDMLLNQMKDEDPAEAVAKKEEKNKSQTYKKYDFYSPKKFTKDKLKIINSIYDNYSRFVTSQLNGLLRTATEIEVMSVEEQRYYEFNNALSENDVMMLQSVELPDKSQNPPIITHITTNLMANMIDRILGGVGNDTDVDAFYSYTDIELELYKQVMGNILSATKEAWSNYIHFEIKGERLETTPSLFRDISFDEAVAIVVLKVVMGETEGRVSICIPGNLLTSMFGIIEKKKHQIGTYEDTTARDRAAIADRLRSSSLTVRANLAEAQLSVRDVCSLKVGDVLDLNKQKDSNVNVYVGDEQWFQGKLGVHQKNMAIKIASRKDHEEIGADAPPNAFVEGAFKEENLEESNMVGMAEDAPGDIQGEIQE